MGLFVFEILDFKAKISNFLLNFGNIETLPKRKRSSKNIERELELKRKK